MFLGPADRLLAVMTPPLSLPSAFRSTQATNPPWARPVL
jgi:hypothetical protein